ncbi:hypothetical protein CDAR_548041 [Caerostris darwini]|uniref:Uncharacterized protein n=1 Tax=Caerostris darwini TaxID=1538125 RepID=A0AAV4WE78_9ARAC|nr:hypothetical protein CDAR_548041 [Caerostris darwini]
MEKERHEDLTFRVQRFVQQAAFLSFSSSFKAPSPRPLPTSNGNISFSAACHLLFAAQLVFQQQIKERFVQQAVFLSSSSFEAPSPTPTRLLMKTSLLLATYYSPLSGSSSSR